jgi:hypothetical protein
VTGLQMLLKSMGITVDPAEVSQAIEQAKIVIQQAHIAIPTIVRKYEEIDARLKRIEEILESRKAITNGR